MRLFSLLLKTNVSAYAPTPDALFSEGINAFLEQTFYIFFYFFEASAYAAGFFFGDKMRFWGKHLFFFIFLFLRLVRTPQALFFLF